MAGIVTEQLEVFINNVLKEDLKYLEQHITRYNEEIMEFVQLKNTLETLMEDCSLPFKTQMNIGGNFFLEAQITELDPVLVDVGLGYLLEFTPEEAIKFADFKIKVLTKECEVVRTESIKKRADIKVSLLYLAEQQKFKLNANERSQ